MKAIVVFESMFGNTEAVARAVAAGLTAHGGVDVLNVDEAAAELPGSVQLVVAGGPTHAFGLSRRRTRQAAREQATAPLVSRRTGLREWLDGLPRTRSPVAAAAFATKAAKPRWLPGSAARGAARRLRTRGYRLLAPPENFWVDGTRGPLTEGELEHARAWGARLGAVWAEQTHSAG